MQEGFKSTRSRSQQTVKDSLEYTILCLVNTLNRLDHC